MSTVLEVFLYGFISCLLASFVTLVLWGLLFLLGVDIPVVQVFSVVFTIVLVVLFYFFEIEVT